MNPTHIHLLLNHVAILASLFSVLVFLAGFIKKDDSIKSVALAGFVLAALAAIPVFLTGEPAEETVEHLPGVLESTIEAHEEAAEVAMWLIEITGIISLVGLFLKKVKLVSTAGFTLIIIILSSISSISISYTGYLGGKIRHTELTSNVAADGTIEPGQGEAGENDED